MTWKNHETIGKVNKVWTKSPQEMLDYILMVDKENEEEENHYSPAFYIGKDIAYIRKFTSNMFSLKS